MGFLEPEEELADEAFRDGTVAGAGGKAFFDFVDPEHTGCHAFGGFEGFAEVLFGFADVHAQDGAHVEPVEWEFPLDGNVFCGEGFTAAGDAAQEDSFGRVESGAGEVGFHEGFAFFQPGVEVVESAHVVVVVEPDAFDAGEFAKDGVFELGEFSEVFGADCAFDEHGG